jgi:hypothetical protein
MTSSRQLELGAIIYTSSAPLEENRVRMPAPSFDAYTRPIFRLSAERVWATTVPPNLGETTRRFAASLEAAS